MLNSRGETKAFCGKPKLAQFNKLTFVFYASVLLWMINCVITLSRVALEPQAALFITITRLQNRQMSGINVGKAKDAVIYRKHRYIQVDFIQNDANIVNSFSRILIGYLKKAIKYYWLKSWQFDS